MRNFRSSWLLISVGACALVSGTGSLAQVSSNQVTRVASFGATNALASFQIEPGFRVELVAAEPLVSSPVAIAFDENGRLFVAEMPQETDQANIPQRSGRIRLLEDRDEQGQFQASSVFAEDLAWPSALGCFMGGVFVASTPDVIYLKDTSGDGVAEVNRTVLSGFGGSNTLSARALLNNFNWGLEDRVYGATAGLAGLISSSNRPGTPVSIGSSDFSFNPGTLAVAPEAGPAQSGLSFDVCGRQFMCDPSRPLRVAMYAQRYWLRNPFFAKATQAPDVASPATPIFRSGMGAAKPGSATAWLTNAQGLVVYRGNAFPPSYAGNVFVCDPDAHVVHRMVLRETGLEITATRAANERNSEFLASRDPSFRPVQAINGPEGALYIVDRQAARDQGRIYRILPEKFKVPKLPALENARTYDLVAALAHPNGWQRDTSSRLLFEREDAAAIPLLGGMLTNSSVPVARLHALHALAALGALKEGHVLRALQDTDICVRQHGLAVSEGLMSDGSVSDALWNQLKQLAADSSIRIRHQAALTLGAARRPDKPLVLARILARDPTNDWVQSAVLGSLGEGAGTMLRLLGNEPRFRNDPVGLSFLRRLALMIGTKGQTDEVAQAIDFLGRAPLQRFESYTLVAALGEGLRRTRSSLALVDTQGALLAAYGSALAVASDTSMPEVLRIEATRMLAVSPYTFDQTSDWLLLICNPQPLTALRAAAIETLGQYDDPRVVPALLDRWAGFPPLLRRQATAAMLARSNRIPTVLAAVEKGAISPADFSSTSLNFLRAHRNPAISDRATRLFGPVPLHRPETLEKFKPALRLRGAAGHGREIFLARCAGCHQPGGAAQAVGPDLAGARTIGKEKLLAAIIEPNAAISAGFDTWVVETEGGDNLIGIKTDDNPVSLTIRQIGDSPAVWPRLNVRSARIQSWSLMPDGAEQGLSTQDMADLIEYLITATP